jgi:hypothetical protein
LAEDEDDDEADDGADADCFGPLAGLLLLPLGVVALPALGGVESMPLGLFSSTCRRIVAAVVLLLPPAPPLPLLLLLLLEDGLSTFSFTQRQAPFTPPFPRTPGMALLPDSGISSSPIVPLTLKFELRRRWEVPPTLLLFLPSDSTR